MSESVMSRVVDVFREVFEDDELSVTSETTADDVDGWDSLTHVTLIVSIEKHFGVRFTASEVTGLKNVGELASLTAQKVQNKS